MYDVTVHIGQSTVNSVVAHGELLVVDAQLVQDRGVEVVDADGVLDGRVTEVVGPAVTRTALDAAAGHPRSEGLHVVITPRVSCRRLLRCRRAAQLAAPDNER